MKVMYIGSDNETLKNGRVYGVWQRIKDMYVLNAENIQSAPMFPISDFVRVETGNRISDIIDWVAIEAPGVYSLVSVDQERYKKNRCYCISINRQMSVTFEEVILLFDSILASFLKENEKLEHRDKSFILYTEETELTFLLLGYDKYPNMIGYLENGKPVVELMHRPRKSND